MLHLRTLGDFALFEFRESPVPLLRGVKPLFLPAVLSTQPGYEASRDHLAALIWPGADPDRARSSLRQAVHHLNKYGRGGGLEAEDGHLRVSERLLTVDLWEFEEAVQAGRVEDVVAAFGGPFVRGARPQAGRELTQWIESQEIRTHTALSAAYSQLVQERLRDGAIQEALQHAQDFARMDPLSERAQLTLIRTLRAVGQDVRALQAYEAYKSLLMSELEEDLSPAATEGLEQLREEAIREPDPASVVYITRKETGGAGDDTHFGVPKRLAWAGLGAVLALIVVGLGWWMGQGGSEQSPRVHVGAVLRGDRLVDLVLGPAGIRLDRRAHAATFGSNDPEVVNPARTKLAYAISGPDGRDLLLEDLRTGEGSEIATGPEDDIPRAWSPDGRYLLFSSGRASADLSRFSGRLVIADVGRGVVRQLNDLEFPVDNLNASWSPLGTDLAVVYYGSGPERGVYFVRPDGTGLRFVPVDEVLGGVPSWSPDGRAVVVSAGPRGAPRLLVVPLDPEAAPTPLPTAEVPLGPLWISNKAIAFLAAEDDGGALRILDIPDRRERSIEAPAGLLRLRPEEVVPGDSSWVDSISFGEVAGRVSPGQLLFLEVSATGPRGKPTGVEDSAIRWGSSDTTVLRPLEPGWFRVAGPGPAEIVADLAGWRRATAAFESEPLVELDAELLFEEDWTAGLRDDVWIRFGDPVPTVQNPGGPDGSGYLACNGDNSFTSGVVSSGSFRLSGGLTLEVWGQAPFSGQHWQDLRIGLIDSLPPGDSVAVSWAPPRTLPYIDLHGFSGRVSGRGFGPAGISPPIPEQSERWHRYAIQLSADGTVRLIVDGSLYWQGRPGAPWDPGAIVHLMLDGNTVRTDIRHGPVRVWAGERYGFR